MHLIQIDIVTAFLHAKIDRLKHINIPNGVDGNRKTKVGLLNKALYGLPISPMCWYKTFDRTMKKNEFERNIREPCLYLKRVNNQLIIVVNFVDDILLASANKNLLDETINLLSKDFEVKNMGFPSRFLGIDISKDSEGHICLSQEKFLEKFLKEFKMDESHAVKNPMLRQVDYSKLIKNQTVFPYKNVLGNLMWLANYTRPDISFAISFLARYQVDPTEEH